MHVNSHLDALVLSVSKTLYTGKLIDKEDHHLRSSNIPICRSWQCLPLIQRER